MLERRYTSRQIQATKIAARTYSNVEIFYESGEVRVHQPYRRQRKRHTLYVETDEWFSGDVARETTNANGDIEIDVRHDDGVFRYVLKKWRWRIPPPPPVTAPDDE